MQKVVVRHELYQIKGKWFGRRYCRGWVRDKAKENQGARWVGLEGLVVCEPGVVGFAEN